MSVGVVEASQRRTFRLPARAESVPEGRRLLVGAAERFVDPDRIADLRVVITEVVSNAVRHGSPEDEFVLLAATPKDDYLCVQVTDAGEGLAPRPRATAPREDGGFGFFLIEQLTRRWGMTREDGRTRVWFEFDFTG